MCDVRAHVQQEKFKQSINHRFRTELINGVRNYILIQIRDLKQGNKETIISNDKQSTELVIQREESSE